MNIEKNILKILFPIKNERPKALNSDYLFSNLKSVKKNLFCHPNDLDTFLIKERWKTTRGLSIYEGVKAFIDEQIKTQSQPQNKQPIKIDNKIDFIQKQIILDFSSIFILHEGSNININDLWDKFDTSKYRGTADLRGIDFSGFKFQQKYFKNGHFPNSCFKNSYYNLVKFENCHFQWCDFSDAKLISNSYKNTTFSGSNMQNAWVENIPIDDINGISLNKITFKHIVFNILRMLFKKPFKEYVFNKIPYTFFKSIKIEEIDTIENEILAEYIFWFERLYKNINEASLQNIIKRLNLMFIVLATKLWKLFTYLISASLLLNILYSILYMINYEHINGLYTYHNRIADSFVDSFYFSIITFTTLGFGDISPINIYMKLLVITEVLIGYSVLGIFIFLLSNRLSRNIYK